jgi:RNA polymerase primary sigma factor
MGPEDSTAFAEVVADPRAAAPFDRILEANDHELVREVMTTLDARESKVLTLRFGLGDGLCRTLEEVGGHFGVTRERIRQIQNEALKKLRARMVERDQPSVSVLTE